MLWGGTFQALTCSPFTNFDTMIWTGTGCPAATLGFSAAQNFGCVQGNDDNDAVCSAIPAPPGCIRTGPGCPPGYVQYYQSAANIMNLQTSVAYVLVGSYSPLPAGSRYGFMFSYT